MKRTVQWIVASLFTGLLLAGCVAPSDPDEEEEVTEPGVSPQSWVYRTTTYYSEPAHINEVGYCIWQICWAPKGTTCYGSTSPYYTVENESSCY
jgi:hypothetical protein